MQDPARTVGVVLEPNAFHPGRSGRNHLRILADGAGIDMDGSKAFVATAADQQSLMAFAFNAMIGTVSSARSPWLESTVTRPWCPPS
jgi:hypothetical protein